MDFPPPPDPTRLDPRVLEISPDPTRGFLKYLPTRPAGRVMAREKALASSVLQLKEVRHSKQTPVLFFSSPTWKLKRVMVLNTMPSVCQGWRSPVVHAHTLFCRDWVSIYSSSAFDQSDRGSAGISLQDGAAITPPPHPSPPLLSAEGEALHAACAPNPGCVSINMAMSS